MLAKQGGTALLLVAPQVPELVVALFVVLFGLAFGSFLNVCITRLPQHASLVHPGSHCPRCGAAIRPQDNVPLLSWMLLGGRCRSCRERIPWRYPAVELATAALFLLSYLRDGLGVAGAGLAVFCFLLLGLAVMDAERMRLPDAFTLPGLLLGLVHAAQLPAHSLQQRLAAAGEALLWAVLAALALLFIRWVYFLLRNEEGIGMGDVKLLAMIAAWLGPAPTVLTLLLGTTAAALYGVAMVGLSGEEGGFRTTRLPMGSFLCAAGLYVVFAGEPILAWYMKFFP